MPRRFASPSLVLLAAALVLHAGAGCRRRDGKPAEVTAPPPAADGMPSHYPATLDPARYAGAAACADCHPKEFAAWQRSPHGRAMSVASPATVLGDFRGQTVEFPDGRLRFVREGDAFYVFDGDEKHRVDLTLGAGRQHQLYVTRDGRGALRLLPAYWATQTREWVLTTVSLGTSLDPSSPRHWRRAEIVSKGNCFHCHLSQGRAHPTGDAVETTWVDLPVNCEACHGPGRAHVEARKAKRADEYRNLKLMSKEEEAALCARCHAGQRLVWSAHRPAPQYATLASPIFRADGSQFGTPYQYAGHVSAECFRRGALTCSACHDPHAQTPRTLAGESAAGSRADLQCTVCHRDLAAPAAAETHGRHKKPLRCVDCHMPARWLTDSETSRQRVADHSIAIPRPRETIDHRIPNACNGCHTDKDPAWSLAALARWKQDKALGVRPWVRAFALGKTQQPGATEALVGVLQDPSSGPLWRASALEILSTAPPDPALVTFLAPLAEHRDPTLRAAALRALFAHDVARRESWMMGAAVDDDPLVRSVLSDWPGPLPLADDQLRAFVLELARNLGQPPGEVFTRMARNALAAGQRPRAKLLLDLALPHATPLQIELLGMRELRASVAE